MTADQHIERTLAIIGALVPVLSTVASLVNHIIRSRTDAGQQVSPAMLHAGAFLNVASVNMDKAVQLAKMARGQEVPVTTKAAPPTPQPPADNHVA